MHRADEIKVGQVVNFVFTTAGRGSCRHRNYAEGEVMKVAAKLSIKVLDKPEAHEFWRKAHVGKVKVVSVGAVIPDLPEAAPNPDAECDCMDHANGFVSNECPVHNENPRVFEQSSGRSVLRS